jgi:hypothetical protein
MSEPAEFMLPGGMLDPQGRCHREGRLRPVTGEDEEWLHSLVPAMQQANVVTALLSRCVLGIGPYAATPDAIRDLSVGDRDYLLLALRGATFGPKVSRVFTCPQASCGAKMDLDLFVADFPVYERPAQPSHRLRIAGPEAGTLLDVEYRVPRGREQELIAAWPSGPLDSLRDRFLESCVVRVALAGDGAELPFAALPASCKETLAEIIEETSPRVELELELVCPECAHTFDVLFDPASLLLDDIGADRAGFERELHLLAFHYHWSLDEILRLARPRRQRFLRVLADELGARTVRS